MQARFSNPFKRASNPPKPSPPAPSPNGLTGRSSEPGFVPLADYKQSTLLGGRGTASDSMSPSVSASSLPPTSGGRLGRAQNGAAHAEVPGSDLASENGDSAGRAPSARASTNGPAPEHASPRMLRRFFTRTATAASSGLQALPEHAAEEAAAGAPSGDGAKHRVVHFSPEEGQRDHSTTPDRIALRGKERRSISGTQADRFK